MSAAAAGDGLHWSLYEGCISGRDMSIQRRPYHKNCNCALHKERGHCAHSSRSNTVSYPIRRTWSDGCLSLMNPSNNSATTGATSPTVAAAATVQGELTRTQTHLVLCQEEDEELD